uniref:Cullin domain-containing protein n=1 Tax=Steinernema glaseri TaxID=37863 RepID=A0A1I7Z0Q6_9BILA
MKVNVKFTVDGAFASIVNTLTKLCRGETLSAKEYISLYTTTTDFSYTNNGALMYEALRRFYRQFISEKAAQIEALTTPVDRLLEYKSAWENIRSSEQAINGTFRYFDRNWVKRTNRDSTDNGDTAEVLEAYTLCMVTWLEEIYFDRNWVKRTNRDSTDNGDTAEVFEAYTLCMVTWLEEMFKKKPGVITQSALAVLKEEEDWVQGARVDLVKVVTESLVELNRLETVGMDTSDEDDEETGGHKVPQDARQLLLAFEEHLQ